MNEHCSTIVKDALPLKVKDPESFTLPYAINNVCFDKALADLGASVSVIPYSTFTNLDFVVVENMDAYHDKDIGDVIVGKQFCRVACVEARRFDVLITIHNGKDSVTYQMARSHQRLKHLYNEQCNKIRPILKVSARDKLEGKSHAYQKLKEFFKGVLNLGPEYIKDKKKAEWLTHGHMSMHEID
ncbi:hypothetical protein Tco_0604292 [Tanacetum coccineum]